MFSVINLSCFNIPRAISCPYCIWATSSRYLLMIDSPVAAKLVWARKDILFSTSQFFFSLASYCMSGRGRVSVMICLSQLLYGFLSRTPTTKAIMRLCGLELLMQP